MPFKVVQTVEDGELLLTFCPDHWERSGKLYWPKSMFKGEKLKTKEDSKPSNDWMVMNCEVKRNNLTLSQARAAVRAMSDLSETEEEENTRISKQKKRKLELNNNFNDIAQQCVLTQKEAITAAESIVGETLTPVASTVSESIIEEPAEKSQSPIASSAAAGSIAEEPAGKTLTSIPMTLEVQSSNEQQQQLFSSSDVYFQQNEAILDTNKTQTVLYNQENLLNNCTLADKIEVLFSALIVVQESQRKLEETQDRILKIITNTDSKLEEYFKKTQAAQKNAYVGMEPIDNIKSLKEFEEKLKDAALAFELKRKFLTVCGSGKGKGINNCYSLVDVMFSRRFLTECSWAGGSRETKGDTESQECQETPKGKICFKAYEQTFNFFYSIVRESDPSFTILECMTFFKNILRNSKRRNSAKGIRTSASRVRPKNMGKGKGTKDSIMNSNKSSTSAADPSQNGVTDSASLSAPNVDSNKQNE